MVQGDFADINEVFLFPEFYVFCQILLCKVASGRKCLSQLTYISSPMKNCNQIILALREAALNKSD